MTTLVIVSSRNFQPLKLVEETIHLTRPTEIVAFGTSAVARWAVEAGRRADIPARNATLDSSRAHLLEAARQPGAIVAVFVASDVASKQPSTGIAGIMSRLDGAGIAYRRIDAPCTPRTCEAVTHLLREVETLTERAATEWRRKAIVTRVLARGIEADELRQKLRGRLDAGWNEAESSDANWIAWSSWLESYRCLCDALTAAQRVLTAIEASDAALIGIAA